MSSIPNFCFALFDNRENFVGTIYCWGLSGFGPGPVF
jgi:hypothetical protein